MYTRRPRTLTAVSWLIIPGLLLLMPPLLRSGHTDEAPESTTQLTPAPAISPEPSPTPTIKATPEPRRDDRVYVNEIEPEYCRVYFWGREWVSIWDYQRGMYICKYGIDH